MLAAHTLPLLIVLVHEDQLARDFKATSTGTHEWHTLVSRRRCGSLDSSALKQIDNEKVAMRARPGAVSCECGYAAPGRRHRHAAGSLHGNGGVATTS